MVIAAVMMRLLQTGGRFGQYLVNADFADLRPQSGGDSAGLNPASQASIWPIHLSP